MTSEFAVHWTLDPTIDYLNHGAFGACPRPVLEAQQELRARLEREPAVFLVRELEARLDATRGALGSFLHAAPEDLVFVPNATTGVNTVVQSLAFDQGDEILTTDHAYAACRNAIDVVARRSGARVVVAAVPFPVHDSQQVVDAVLAAAGPRTRLALIDHIASPTGLIFPVEQLVPQLRARGIETLVDGAHAPGMVPVDLEALGAAYYTANCHKWLCGPKGAAFLWVRRDQQAAIHPLVVSHGAASPRRDRARFLMEFDWTGTDDPTAILAVPVALTTMAGLVPGGWPEVQRRNHALALAGRRALCEALQIASPTPDAMIGSLASVPLPAGDPDTPALAIWTDPLQAVLFQEHQIEVPVFQWPRAPHRLVRIAAQLYNTPAQYERLATTLATLLPAGSSR